MVTIFKDIVIKVKSDIDKEYRPLNIVYTEWYEVFGVNSWTYKDDKGHIQTVIKFLIVNDKMELSSIAYHNCLIAIKDRLHRTMPVKDEKKI